MPIAMRLREFLDLKGVNYDTVAHQYSSTARRAAETSHIPANHVAKSVVVQDDAGFVMAVIPADQRLDVELLCSSLGRELSLADEIDLKDLLYDCQAGAIPAAGEAFGFEVALDERLMDCDEVFFEAGDHTDLVHVAGADFRLLMAHAQQGDYCRPG